MTEAGVFVCMCVRYWTCLEVWGIFITTVYHICTLFIRFTNTCKTGHRSVNLFDPVTLKSPLPVPLLALMRVWLKGIVSICCFFVFVVIVFVFFCVYDALLREEIIGIP